MPSQITSRHQISHLKIPLKLRAHSLHVDLKPQLCVLSQLQIVLNLLILCL